MKHSGYATITDPSRPLQEYDTVACAHCGAVIFVKAGTASTVYLVVDPATNGWQEVDGAGCFKCGYQPICLPCYDKGTCTPLERQLEQMEGKVRGGRLLLM